MASAAFVALASVVPWQQVASSVELGPTVAALAVAGAPAGLAEASLVAGVPPAVVVAAAVVAAAAAVVAADRDSYIPTDDSIRPTGQCSPVVQQLSPP